MSDFLPLMLDLSGKEVIIFGGGNVGERKATLFCEHTGVTVVSREFTQGLDRLSTEGKIKLIKTANLTEKEILHYIENAFIVIPATNDAGFNEKIHKLASDSGKLVNRVDEFGDIIVPSVIRRGDIVIGISTHGASPAISKYIRKKLEEVITPEFEQMSRLQKEVREMLKSQVTEQEKRKEILWNILNDNDVWAALGESYEKAYKLALKL